MPISTPFSLHVSKYFFAQKNPVILVITGFLFFVTPDGFEPSAL